MRAILLAVGWCCAASLPANAQTVVARNISSYEYAGYTSVRLTSVPAWAGWSHSTHWPHWAASDDGDEALVDVWLRLNPGETRHIDLAATTAVVRPVASLPDLSACWAGQPLLCGRGVQWSLPSIGGAGCTLRGHSLVGDWIVGIELRIYVGQLAWQPATLRVRGAPWLNGPTVSPDITVAWGDATVWTPHGLGIARPALLVDDPHATESIEVTLYWPRLDAAAEHYASAQCARVRAVACAPL